ncbi:MAG: GTPase Era [Nitrospirae bacterium]|nr:GTPase Era [Candidatus Troglogloeales bacterium]MBI3598677.1 GTPase Era [Candidatus Troglogloeales bacterium]
MTPYVSGFVAIVGRPNVGKSTFLNQVLGQKISIVSDKPQTTRNKILGVKHLPTGQIIFFDTPGIHHPAEREKLRLNQRMVQTARSAVREVDLILLLIEPQRTSEDQLLFDILRNIKTPRILVVNKIDLVGKSKLIPLLDGLRDEKDDFSEMIPICAKTGENMDKLIDLTLSYLPEGMPYFPEDQVTDQPVRFLASEIVREKVIEKTHDEIPYVVSVQIEKFREDEIKALIHIEITIYVEKDSQKGILIGRKGGMLKEIGSAARLELEGLLATKVFLQLWVKVKKEWRKNDLFLNEMGY